MIKILLGLAQPPAPHDAADALAVALCHLHSMRPGLGTRPSGLGASDPEPRIRGPEPRVPSPRMKSWRQYRPPVNG
jgi:hypothetical protein